jgi:CBS domain-containing protein
MNCVDSASVSAFAALSSGGAGSEPKVADAMHWGLVSCPSDASLKSVAALMNDERVHCVVVIDDPSDARSLWGVISDLDLVAAASVRGLMEQKAGGTAMTPAVTIAPGEQLEHAANLMTKHGVAHLVVVDPIEQRPVGVLSTLDLAAALAVT